MLADSVFVLINSVLLNLLCVWLFRVIDTKINVIPSCTKLVAYQTASVIFKLPDMLLPTLT